MAYEVVGEQEEHDLGNDERNGPAETLQLGGQAVLLVQLLYLIFYQLHVILSQLLAGGVVPQAVEVADAHQVYLAAHDVAGVLALKDVDAVGGHPQALANAQDLLLQQVGAELRTLTAQAGIDMEQRILVDDDGNALGHCPQGVDALSPRGLGNGVGMF